MENRKHIHFKDFWNTNAGLIILVVAIVIILTLSLVDNPEQIAFAR